MTQIFNLSKILYKYLSNFLGSKNHCEYESHKYSYNNKMEFDMDKKFDFDSLHDEGVFERKKRGRKSLFTEEEKQKIKEAINNGAVPSRIAEKLGVSVATITRIRDK